MRTNVQPYVPGTSLPVKKHLVPTGRIKESWHWESNSVYQAPSDSGILFWGQIRYTFLCFRPWMVWGTWR